MSLNWNISNVQNWEEKAAKYGETLEFLVWESLSIGMSRITATNVDEWYYRIQRRRIDGGYTLSPITREDIAAWVGMCTNVSTLTAKEFDTVLKDKYPDRYKLTRKQLER